MNREKTHQNMIEESYDPDILTDLHSPEIDPSSYARNIRNNAKNVTPETGSISDKTEKIPSAIKFSDPDIKKTDDEFDYQGEL